MDRHSKAKSFEKAALYRDKISSLRDIQRSQSVVGFSKERDAITVSSVNGQIKAGITHVREGWVTGHENFIQKNNLLEGSSLEYFILTYYLNEVYCPSTLVIGEPIKDKQVIERALSEHHNKSIKILYEQFRKNFTQLKLF